MRRNNKHWNEEEVIGSIRPGPEEQAGLEAGASDKDISTGFINCPHCLPNILNVAIYIKMDLVTLSSHYCQFTFGFINYNCK